MRIEKNATFSEIHFLPVRDFKIFCDKLTQDIFDANNDTGVERGIVEDKHLKIYTEYNIEMLKGDLNQLDRLTFFAACSEYLAGNEIFTINRLYHLMGGGHILTGAMRKIIDDSVERLACTRFYVDMTPLNDRYQLTDKTKAVFKNYFLPISCMKVKVGNHTPITAFKIIDTPPLLKVAEMKNQIITVDYKLLDVPNLKNTDLVMKIKGYLLERIAVIKGSHEKHPAHIVGKKKEGGFFFKRATKLRKIILLESLFAQCELSDASRNRKAEYRKVIEKVLEHFKAEKFISEWRFEMKSGSFYSIHFT